MSEWAVFYHSRKRTYKVASSDFSGKGWVRKLRHNYSRRDADAICMSMARTHAIRREIKMNITVKVYYSGDGSNTIRLQDVPKE